MRGVASAWRRAGSHCARHLDGSNPGRSSPVASGLLVATGECNLHSLATAAASCRTAFTTAAQSGTRAAWPAATATASPAVAFRTTAMATPASTAAWRRLLNMASGICTPVARELRAATSSNAAFYRTAAGRAAGGWASGDAAAAAAAASGRVAPSGTAMQAAARTAGGCASRSGSRAGAGLGAGRAAFSTRPALSGVPQQSAWVSDPAALQQAAGVGTSSGASGMQKLPCILGSPAATTSHAFVAACA